MINEYLENYEKSRENSMVYCKDFSFYDDYKYRSEFTKKYAWAIPTEEALDTIVKYSPIIEIGAGTGYWAYLLHQKGTNIICFDKEPYNNHWCRNQWFEIKSGSFEVLTIQENKNRNLFLCWPPYDDSFATKCLNHFRGNYLIYIGECQGGCCADDDFFELLEKNYMKIKYVSLLQWSGIHDDLYIFKRKLLNK